MNDIQHQTIVALLPVSLLGTILNWSIVFSIQKLSSFNHSFGYLSGNQALADALHSTTFLLYFCPMVLLDQPLMKHFSHHCGFVLLFCYELSVLTHFVISVNRCFAAWVPYYYQYLFTDEKTKIIIVGVWLYTGTVAIFFYEKLCYFYYDEKTQFLTFTKSEFCGKIGWYGDFLKNATIVAVIVCLDIMTVIRVRKVSKRIITCINQSTQQQFSRREIRFLKQTVFQGGVFLLELLTYFFVPQYFENRWVVFFATSFAWVAIHAVDGIVVIICNPEIRRYLFSRGKMIHALTTTIPFEGKDPMVYGYLCAVDRCIYEFFEETKDQKFEVMWRKLPESMNWCATNAQMSVVKFTSKREILMFKVNNMLEKRKQAEEKCTAVVISFDDDSSLRDLDLERVLKVCTVHHVVFSSSRIHGLANVLKSISSTIDLLIVGPSKSSSHLLFQQFLGDYNDYLPTVCQINFAHSLPRSREENGFMESVQKLRSEKKYLLMGSSKDRTDMHLNLFFENMDQKYCRERYFRYFSYF